MTAATPAMFLMNRRRGASTSAGVSLIAYLLVHGAHATREERGAQRWRFGHVNRPFDCRRGRERMHPVRRRVPDARRVRPTAISQTLWRALWRCRARPAVWAAGR